MGEIDSRQNETPDSRSSCENAAGRDHAAPGEKPAAGKDRAVNPKLIDVAHGKLRMLHYAKTGREGARRLNSRFHPVLARSSTTMGTLETTWRSRSRKLLDSFSCRPTGRGNDSPSSVIGLGVRLHTVPFDGGLVQLPSRLAAQFWAVEVEQWRE